MGVHCAEKSEARGIAIKFLAIVYHQLDCRPEWLLDENASADHIEYVNAINPNFNISRKEVADELSLIREKRERVNRLQTLKEEVSL